MQLKQELLLKRERLGELIALLAKDRAVLGPARQGGDVRFAAVASAEQLALDSPNARLSPKEAFFPSCETMAHVEGDRFVEDLPDKRPRVLFGVRPCDARGTACLDIVFAADGIRDPYYLDRREGAVVLAQACDAPLPTCFCTLTGGAPDGEQGVDVQMFPVAAGWIFRPLTEAGAALLGGAAALFEKPGAEALAQRDAAVAAARAKLPDAAEHEAIKAALDAGFDAEHWEPSAAICASCGTCVYLCPTCHCFDVADETVAGVTRRIRCWDSCQYGLFTFHGSGHQPRATKGPRLRQRVMHKFKYTVDNYGEVFCVGCGRCVRECPTNLDLRQVLRAVLDAKPVAGAAGGAE